MNRLDEDSPRHSASTPPRLTPILSWAIAVRKSLLWLLVVGLGLLIASILLEEIAHRSPHADVETTEQSLSVLLTDLTVYATLCREIAFATFIAFLLAVLIEEDAQKQQQKLITTFTEQVSGNVFRTVLGTFLPQRFLDLFLDVARSPLFRKNMVVRYRLLEFKPPEVRGISKLSDEYLKLSVFAEYTLVNASASPYVHPIRFRWPSRKDSRFHRDTARLVSLEIDGKPVKLDHLERGESDFEIVETRTIQPGEELVITSEMTLVKERSDSEVWSSLIPTLDLRIIFEADQVSDPTTAGLTANFRVDQRSALPNSAGGIWVSTQPIMPYQSVVFWWRQPFPSSLNRKWDERRKLGDSA